MRDVECDRRFAPQGSPRCAFVQMKVDGFHFVLVLRCRPIAFGKGARALPLRHGVELLTKAIGRELHWTIDVHP